eukprot:651454_1
MFAKDIVHWEKQNFRIQVISIISVKRQITLVNFKYADINDKLVRNEAFQWQRILAFVVQQSDMAFNCKQRFMNQDDDMFYNLGNIVMKWIMVYGSGSSKQIVNEWFRVDRWKK